jgi:Skp family chaperone for outer membrane proteins
MKKIFFLLLVLINLSMVSFGQEKGTLDRKIGIVNVSEVLSKYSKRIDLEKGWKKDEEIFNGKVKEKSNEIEKLRQELSEATDDLDYEKISNDLTRKNKELKFYGELSQERMQREIGKFQLEMIRDIKKTIQDYGEENKFFLILQTRPINAKSSNNLQDAILMINLSDVMYYDKNYDITDKIVALINDRYTVTKKQPAK